MFANGKEKPAPNKGLSGMNRTFARPFIALDHLMVLENVRTQTIRALMIREKGAIPRRRIRLGRGIRLRWQNPKRRPIPKNADAQMALFERTRNIEFAQVSP